MLMRMTSLTLALIIGIVLVGTAQTPKSGKPTVAPPALTPQDILEIRQLVARYAYAVDTGADNGSAYASLFAPDGAFLDRTGGATTGFENLAALARRNTRGQQSAFHFIMNHVIEPSAAPGRRSAPNATMATGKEYLVQLRMGEGERPNEIFGGGHYEDVYVKTRDGWRFKQRQFLPSQRPPPRQSAR
jgi:actinorhodin biosynthesis protein ActVIA